MGEPVDVAEFGHVCSVADEQLERAAGLDGGQLCPVADQDDFRAGSAGLCDEGVEGERAGQGCFVDDHQLTGPQRPFLYFAVEGFELPVEAAGAGDLSCPAEFPAELVDLGAAPGVAGVLDQPFRGVLGRDPDLVGEHLGGGGGRGQTDDRPGAVLVFPGGAEAGHGGRLPGPGRTDQHVDDPPRRDDLLDREPLLTRTAAGRAAHRGVGETVDGGGVDPWAVEGPAGVEEPCFGVQQCFGGVDLVVGCPEPGGAVGAPERGGGVGQVGWADQQGVGEGEVGWWSRRPGSGRRQ